MIFSQYHLKLFKIPTQGKNWIFLIHLLRTFSMFYTTHVLLVLTSFHKTVKQTLPLVREPVACHGCHCSHEHRGVDQISFSSQCGQNTEEHPKKHLLQHLHLIILNVLKQTFVLETCRRNKTRLLAKPNQEDELYKCSKRRLTGKLLPHTSATFAEESVGAVTVERALSVDTDLIQTVAGKNSVTAFIHIWAKDRNHTSP